MVKPKTNNSRAFYSRSRVCCFGISYSRSNLVIPAIKDTKGSIEIMEDNQSTIAMAKSSVGHKRTKHIDIKHRFIRETVQTGKITLSYCPTANMLADIFTKRLPRTQFEKLRDGLGLV